ncbi:hypothetical protein GW17_00023357 [Ensete ventricosum]|nr:hypothetical protein GW17_00023357 [Ensete ventricosum]
MRAYSTSVTALPPLPRAVEAEANGRRRRSRDSASDEGRVRWGNRVVLVAPAVRVTWRGPLEAITTGRAGPDAQFILGLEMACGTSKQGMVMAPGELWPNLVPKERAMAWKEEEELGERNGSARIDIRSTTPADSSHARLHELGYKQELKLLSNFSFSFSSIFVLIGITIRTYGWFVAGIFTMSAGLSMAEICSSYPTSDGLYYWSARFSGKQWAPFTLWMIG